MTALRNAQRSLADAIVNPPMNPEIRAQSLALLGIIQWLNELDRRLQTIERKLGIQ